MAILNPGQTIQQTDGLTNRQTDIATLRPSRPRGAELVKTLGDPFRLSVSPMLHPVGVLVLQPRGSRVQPEGRQFPALGVWWSQPLGPLLC